jgi:hypothetical protein
MPRFPPLGGPPQDERTSTRLVEWQAMSLLHRLHAPEVGRGGRPATRAGIDRRGPAPDGGPRAGALREVAREWRFGD